MLGNVGLFSISSRRGLFVLFFVVTVFGVFQNALAKNDQTQNAVVNSPRTVISEEAKNLLFQKWDDDTVEKGLHLIGNRTETVDSRRAVLEKFRSEGKKLSLTNLTLLFKQTISLAKDKTETPELSMSAIQTMENAGVLLKEKRQMTKEEVRHEASFLVEIVGSRESDLKLRGAAIRATGVLGVEEVTPLLRNLLADPAESNKPEIAQNALLAIGRLEGKNAFGPIAEILGRTQNPAIFGTAAFSMGQINTIESLVKLVQNESRFPNSELPDAVLVDMESIVLNVLDNPRDENLSFAIKATRHLWRKGQRERYVPKLHALLTSASLPIKKEALERLFEVASELNLDSEKLEYQIILPLITKQTELSEYSERIQRRMTAVVLAPQLIMQTPKNMGANRR